MNRVRAEAAAGPGEGRVRAVAPVRVADLGGWTDTWFAGHGLVCNVAVRPGVEVRIEPAASTGIVIDAVDFGDRYVLSEGRGRHPLLEATIDEMALPPGTDAVVAVRSAVPPGASTGTSAAVTVALVAALAAFGGRTITPADVAATAHRVEAERLGRQTGVQDQLASAHGGINRIEIRAYPTARVTPVHLRPDVAADLDDRLLLVLLARGHVSSAVHAQVIAALEAGGATAMARLDPLRAAAAEGHAALVAGDLAAYGRALSANTEGQRRLHRELVGSDAQRIIAAAAAHGAAGWKVNGAGGEGGSLTLLSGPGDRRRLAAAVAAADPSCRCVPVTVDPQGVRVSALG